MKEIPVRVCGDQWINPQEVKDLILSTNSDIGLDLGSEGASLTSLGITATVIDLCIQTSRDPSTILVKNWPNAVEHVPFRRAYLPRVSHFWWMSEHYWIDKPIPCTHEYKFGYFVGRRTLSRCTMLFDIYHEFQPVALLSLMNDKDPLPWATPTMGLALEDSRDWVTHDDFYNWWNQCPVSSLDGNTVLDQYLTGTNTNRDLLNHYHCFDIEIIAESYTQGNCFFPTEKTVRPIMAMKPFFVYGPVDYLKRLQDLGFKTFGEIWSEKYDQMQGIERWENIKSVMHWICRLNNNSYQDLIKQCEIICLHNRTNLENLIKKYRPQ